MIGAGYGIALALLNAGLRAGTALALDKSTFAGLPGTPAPDNPSFDVFYHLSRMLTCRDKLDDAVARKMFALFQEEPWGKQHISRCYTKIKTALQDRADRVTMPDLISEAIFDEGEAWFAGHLLMTWYLGAYYHERTEPIRVTWEGALMWDAVDDITGIPGVSGGEPDFWAGTPPPGHGK